MVRVYVVLEEFGAANPVPAGACDFSCAPRVGETIVLTTGGKQIVADITSVTHQIVPAASDDLKPLVHLTALRRPTGEGH